MKKIIASFTFILLCCGSSTIQARPNPADEVDEACSRWVENQLLRLSREEKAGQLMIVALPAKADYRKAVRNWVKTNKVGGLLFTDGTPEEQARLTNLARKNAVQPLLIAYDAQRNASLPLKGSTRFPSHDALGCLTDKGLYEAYSREIARQQKEMQVAPVSEAVLQENGMLLVDISHAGVIDSVHADVASGKISAQELNERCRKVLAYKYQCGAHNLQPVLKPKGITARLHTEQAQKLSLELHQGAVTVLKNCFGVLPLTAVDGGIAVLNISNENGDLPFAEAMKKYSDIHHYHLTWYADEAERQQVAEQLAPYRRVIVTVTDVGYISNSCVKFLSGLKLRGALAYVFFTSRHPLLTLSPALDNASAIVLAHSDGEGLQRHVADVLFARAKADGKLTAAIGAAYPTGTGYFMEPGMEPGELIPDDYGMSSSVLHGMDAIARKGLAEGAYTGCRVLVWKEGRTIYDKGFGTHSDTDDTPVRPTDLFDLSTMTKSTATLLAVMKLYDEGRLKLTDKVSQYIPSLRTTNKKGITVRELLLHESGLPAYIRFYLDLIDPNSVKGPYSQSWEDEWHHTRVSEHGYYSHNFKFRKGLTAAANSATHSMQMADGLWVNKSFRNTILQQIAKAELSGKKYVYSELGFLLLQQVVENIVKMPLNSYLDATFYEPMGLERTLFLPLGKYAKEEVIPTAKNDYLRRQDLRGYVHDETAACLGGISGNAGLFSTAHDVAAIYQMLLNGGEWNGKRYLSEETCRLFTTEKSAVSRRVLGFDKPDKKEPHRTPCADSAPETVFGDTGFAGTCVWVDPASKVIYVFMSNALCPNAWNTKLGDMDIQTDIHELICKSLK